MVSDKLRYAYNFHRARAVGNVYPVRKDRKANVPAIEALKAARADVEAGKARYTSSPWGKQYAKPGDGLRLVGRVAAECGGRNGYFSDDGGWYTDPDGMCFNDGSGLCYGVVYQLPARKGLARFIAGHEFGGVDGGPSLDLSTVYTGEDSDNCSYEGAQGNPAARDAARAADHRASRAAEDEREYQTAWRAGNDYAEAGEEIAALRGQVKEDLASRRTVREDMRRAGLDTTSREWARCCAMVRSRVTDALERIARLRASRDVLAAGDADRRVFYPTASTRAAFNEGAGETVLS